MTAGNVAPAPLRVCDSVAHLPVTGIPHGFAPVPVPAEVGAGCPLPAQAAATRETARNAALGRQRERITFPTPFTTSLPRSASGIRVGRRRDGREPSVKTR